MAIYPDKPVEPGQSWSEKESPEDRIRENRRVQVDPAEAGGRHGDHRADRDDPVRSRAPPMDAQGMKLRFDVSGSQDATIRIVEATGLIQREQGRQQLKGEIKIGDSAQGQPMMTIPTAFDTTSKVEMSEKMWEPAAK